ncbi:class I SAM-dependent methyltransferase [Tepidibacillus infernus]|uniref:class I SAM-dependent methyltransferase n=1 Tax=Tepidibacillus infernus TaxID=1806172 RepID=UPI003B6FD8AD
MSEHYYTQSPNVAHDERWFKANFYNKIFTFKTDAGVFSKQRVDFGTSLLIETVKLSNHKKILDMGCGYGPVGITIASLLDHGYVLFVDINERAINLTKENIRLNQSLINQQVSLEVKHSNGFDHIDKKNFDLIMLNPPIRAGKSVVFELFEGAFNHLREGGEFWIVIQKKQGAPSATNKLNTLFSSVEIVARSKGYYIIKNTK